MQFDHIPSKIVDWLAVHAFADLSVVQQGEVLQYMTALEYDEFAAIVSDFKEMSTPLPAQEFIRKPIKNNTHWLHRFKIPWPVAATALLLVGFFSFQFARLKYQVAPKADDIPIIRTSQSLAEKMYSDSLVFEL